MIADFVHEVISACVPPVYPPRSGHGWACIPILPAIQMNIEDRVEFHSIKDTKSCSNYSSLPLGTHLHPLQLNIVKHLAKLSPVRAVLACVFGSSILSNVTDSLASRSSNDAIMNAPDSDRLFYEFALDQSERFPTLKWWIQMQSNLHRVSESSISAEGEAETVVRSKIKFAVKRCREPESDNEFEVDETVVEIDCKEDPEGLALRLAGKGAVSAALEVAEVLQGRQLVKLLTADPLNGGGDLRMPHILKEFPSLRDNNLILTYSPKAIAALSSKGAIDLCVAQMKNVLSAQQLPLIASMEILGRAYYATETFVQANWAPLSPPSKMSGENWLANGEESGRFGHRNLHCKVKERMEAEVGKAKEGLGGLLVAVGGAHRVEDVLGGFTLMALVFAKSQLRKLAGSSDLSINSEKSRDADDSSSYAGSSGINSPYTDELSELLSQSDIWLGRAELLQSLLGSGIVASLDDIADKESSARLRDRLIEDERYNMVIYTCKKCKIDSFPVWNAWGHALIRVEHYAQACVKFKQAFQLYKGDSTPVILEIINELEGSPPVDVSAVSSMLISEGKLADALALSDHCLNEGASDELLQLLVENGEEKKANFVQHQGYGSQKFVNDSWQYCLRLKDKHLAARLALKYLHKWDLDAAMDIVSMCGCHLPQSDPIRYEVLQMRRALLRYSHILSADDRYKCWQEVEADCKEDPEGLALTLAGKVLKEFPSLRDNNLILTYSAKAIAALLSMCSGELISSKGAIDLCVAQMKNVLSAQQLQLHASMEILGQAYYATETFVHKLPGSSDCRLIQRKVGMQMVHHLRLEALIYSLTVWNAMGHAFIRVEPYAQARVKFKQAFQLYKGDPTPVIPEIINESEGSPPVDVLAVRSMYEHLAKSAPTILDDSLSADSYLNVLYMPSTFPRSERSRLSAEVSNPQYSSNSEFDDGPRSNLDNMRYIECINYFKEYARQLMLGFMFRLGHYTDACMLFFPPDGIPPQPLSLPLASPSSSTQRMDPLATDYGTIDEICDLCVGYGAMGILEDIISARVSMTASQHSAMSQYTASTLARICLYCETHRLFNFLSDWVWWNFGKPPAIQ
ncbi:hypothetical protein QJS10_CPB14g00999 [Acorus calamus]|uniref:Protein ZIP4 homolog n=1 Tax=Acorus calamus TaxID=4465 RepID=A0AAV9DEL8_ACOCL|nr:hypothetical protein QJS10_CPB14g00999 [Acorus calamus]